VRNLPRKSLVFSKFALGTSSRIFELELNNNGFRLPFPIAGPAHFTTASEVATMRYARDILGLPVFRVLSWCSRAENTPVKFEYAIMEKTQGLQLYDIWDNLSNEAWYPHVRLHQDVATNDRCRVQRPREPLLQERLAFRNPSDVPSVDRKGRSYQK